MGKRKAALLGIILLLVAGFFLFDLGQSSIWRPSRHNRLP